MFIRRDTTIDFDGVTYTGHWSVKLSPADAEVMGCEWVPLPLTAAVNVFDAIAFARTIPMYDGFVTVLPE